MSQQQAPWLETAYGWACGDNTGTVQTVNVNLMILGH